MSGAVLLIILMIVGAAVISWLSYNTLPNLWGRLVIGAILGVAASIMVQVVEAWFILPAVIIGMLIMIIPNLVRSTTPTT